jgi:acetyl-CoA carboxylase carboxyltransferase component
VETARRDHLAIIREYLSYMPSHCEELPPIKFVPEGSGSGMDRILDLLPEKRKRVYDMNKILRTIVDEGILFPLKPLYAKSVITSLARMDGEVVGIVGGQPAASHFRGAGYGRYRQGDQLPGAL